MSGESVNGRLLLEPYKGAKKLELEVKKGFGTVKARSTLIGLKLLREAAIHINNQVLHIAKDSVVFFNESTLASQEQYKAVFNFEGSEEAFVIGNYHDVLFVEGP